MKFLITGVAGFIGFSISNRLLNDGHQIIGIDNLNGYYDINLKIARLNHLTNKNFIFHQIDLTNKKDIYKLFSNERFDKVIHLAAQVGVRYASKNPHSYINDNLIGYLNILEGCRYNNIQHLLYASSSSVYGLNNNLPFTIEDSTDQPLSLYAVTKKSNELMSYTYSYLYKIPITGLRFFTIYGPWGRPDMALFKFTKAMIDGRSIDVYNYGNMKRAFTYIDDIVEIIVRIQNLMPKQDYNYLNQNNSLINNYAPHYIYNIGSDNSVKLLDIIIILEKILKVKANKNMLPIQQEDIPETIADTKTLYKAINFKPLTPIEIGIKKFVKWYRKFYNK